MALITSRHFSFVFVLLCPSLARQGSSNRCGKSAQFGHHVFCRCCVTGHAPAFCQMPEIDPSLSHNQHMSKPPSWNEIRIRAARFSTDWRTANSEQSESQIFWYQFLQIFGVESRRVAYFETRAKRNSTGKDGRIDFFWPGMLLVEQKSRGIDLDIAESQAFDYLDDISPQDFPQLLVVSNFQQMRVRDFQNQGVTTTFNVDDLPKFIDVFGALAGYRKRDFNPQQEANATIEAAQLMGRLWDELAASGYEGHNATVLMTRLLFLMFGDDTGLWERGLFTEFVTTRTSEDGSDLGGNLALLFQSVDKPKSTRTDNLDEYIDRFPYINGGIFKDRIEIPTFNSHMRAELLACCAFDWSKISSAIFGSLFQALKSKEDRAQLGEHYTTEENILKVIHPLFLDELREKFDASKGNNAKLETLRKSLSEYKFLDPACGCGNFLVVAYRELRKLELDILKELRSAKPNESLILDVTWGLSIHLNQFYGIEIEEWPAKIAETAMFIVDHQANMELALEFGSAPDRLPISDSPNIQITNAIRIDWKEFVKPTSHTVVLGNPPFVGMAKMSAEQQKDNRLAFELLSQQGLRTGRLDYVGCWYAKCFEYLRGTKGRAAFVSTNSITQGEQARTLGPLFAANGFGISFAHRTFSWSSEAANAAAVHVVIIGFSESTAVSKKLIFDYPDPKGGAIELVANNINIYLADSTVQAIHKHASPLVEVPKLTEGNRPQDGGGLLVSAEERKEIRNSDPIAAKYLKRLIGAQDMLHGEKRWCLWLLDADPKEIRSSPTIKKRLLIVRKAREGSPTEAAREKAKTPSLFLAIRQPDHKWLCVPRVSSENRRIIPMAFFTPDDIAHDTTLALSGADSYLFGILQSTMFTVWVKAVSGRLESRIRVSPDLSYNSFPFPEGVSKSSRDRVIKHASRILEVRKKYPGACLADLYDPSVTPADLSAAHDELDTAVDSLFGKRKFNTIAQRESTLFTRYQLLSSAEFLFEAEEV